MGWSIGFIARPLRRPVRLIPWLCNETQAAGFGNETALSPYLTWYLTHPPGNYFLISKTQHRPGGVNIGVKLPRFYRPTERMRSDWGRQVYGRDKSALFQYFLAALFAPRGSHPSSECGPTPGRYTTRKYELIPAPAEPSRSPPPPSHTNIFVVFLLRPPKNWPSGTRLQWRLIQTRQ